MSIPNVTLASGVQVPRLAFGSGTALYNSDSSKPVAAAIRAGFRHLDHAEVYANSPASGRAIAGCGLPREELYILTKLGQKALLDAERVTREEMQALDAGEQIDAVLLHFPPRGIDGAPSNVEWWGKLSELKDKGLVKTIGVSNWMASDLEELLATNPKHKPEINQIEFSPHLVHHPDYKALLEVHKKHNIVAMNYGSLTSLYKASSGAPKTKLNEVVESISKELGISEAAVLLKYGVQRTDGIAVTTSSKEERCKELIKDFSTGKDLDQSHIQAIEDATKGETIKKFYMTHIWDV